MSMPSDNSFVNLATPPRVLTLDEMPFPTVDDAERSFTMRRLRDIGNEMKTYDLVLVGSKHCLAVVLVNDVILKFRN